MADVVEPESAHQVCPFCGTTLANNVPAEDCPRCLLAAGQLAGAEATVGKTIVLRDLPTGRTNKPTPGEAFGHYQILGILGQGGMGVVYEAQDLENGRRVALKVLTSSLEASDARKRFLREGQLAAAINHPNTVYVYGTEEIEQAPVIAMELMPGGTLRDRVEREGPLSPSAAVDTILQVIAGLEAAQRLGILHRDIKPSNFFIGDDGAVKVGDFGLSISTQIRDQTQLTLAGAFIGTPAFASPEQLRGETLTVQSDIYAVGVTLYYLLTGKTPFQGGNMVQLLAAVLERAPETPARLRTGLPAGLCRTVLRCLEKQAGARFSDYGQLREALLPFASTTPVPATLRLRLLAGFADWWLLIGVTTLIGFALSGDWGRVLGPHSLRDPFSLLLMLVGTAVWLAYYSLLEGLSGASLGKILFRLRVVGPDHSAPGMPRAALRTFLFCILPYVPVHLFQLLDKQALAKAAVTWPTAVVFYSPLALMALMFATARSRNGMSGLHDLLTGLRVIRKSEYQGRTALPVRTEEPPPLDISPKVGPYHVLQTLWDWHEQKLLLGYDTRLLRKVLILTGPPGTSPVSPARRRASRAGRLRWLNGQRTPSKAWDAYEATDGQSLLGILAEPQPWSRVKYWLLDLAEELQAAAQDETIPEALELDRVWITASGQAKLLDFAIMAPPPVAASAALPSSSRCPDALSFLHHAVLAMLGGTRCAASASSGTECRVVLPLPARKFISEIRNLDSPGRMVATLKPLLPRPDFVSRHQRLGLMAACAALPLFWLLAASLGLKAMHDTMEAQPDLPRLHNCVSNLRMFRNTNRQLEGDAMEVLIAARFQGVITNRAAWSSVYAHTLVDNELERLARLAVERHPAPTAEEAAAAEAIVKKYFGSNPAEWNTGIGDKNGFLLLVTMTWAVFALGVMLPGLLAALFFRGGVLPRVFGIAVVNRDGTNVTRGRLFWRNLVAWVGLSLPFGLAGLLVPAMGYRVAAVCGACLLFFFLLAALVPPRRGLQDYVAGTFPVPR